MAFQEKSLQCSDCGKTFPFTVEEQEFFASKGYTNEPKRCPVCRQNRRSERYGNGGGGGMSRGGLARCSPQFAHNVAKRLRYPSSLAATNRYTAEIAT